MKIQEILKKYMIESNVAYIISDSAANMIAGKYLALLYFILEYLELLLTLFLDHFF